jgi:exonuclease VII large subunit
MIKSEYLKVENASDRLSMLQPLNKITFNKKWLSHSYNTITKLIIEKLESGDSQLIGYEKHLNSLGPKQVLDRGYSLAITKNTNQIIRSSKTLLEGDKFYLKTGDGSLEAEKISEIKL